jgi:ABC-type nickel/cobalt efflux system permease component RcnA
MDQLNNFQLLEYAAWGICILLGLWMLFDAIRTDRRYSEDFLTSSREGEIEGTLVIDPPHQGGHL